jgi:hypothetical protein
MQVAPFRQGFEAHSLMLIWHSEPEKPGEQPQEKELTKSVQVPPFWQGAEEHSTISV